MAIRDRARSELTRASGQARTAGAALGGPLFGRVRKGQGGPHRSGAAKSLVVNRRR